MNTFIDPKNIGALCSGIQYDGRYNSETKARYNEDTNQRNESESEPGKWSTFKKKCKGFWTEVKNTVLGIADVLSTVTGLIKAVTGVVKIFKKAKGAFA